MRLSGPLCFAALEELTGLGSLRKRAALTCSVRLLGFAEEARLPCTALCFPGPASYTGEDVVELHCASSPLILEQLASSLLAAGLRLAVPGEFTRRAFENGKQSLEQAEAVLAVINAGTQDALRAAETLASSGGNAGGQRLRSRLIAVLSLLESGLDFEEGETGEVPEELWSAELDALHAELGELKQGLGQIQAASTLPAFLLLGSVNAGKTSLWNALADPGSLATGLVSAEAGTTRDLRWTKVADGRFLLGDSPGRTTWSIAWRGGACGSGPKEQELEILGRELRRADGFIWLEAWSHDPKPPPTVLGEPAILRLLSKADTCDDEARLRELEASGWLAISLPGGRGLDELVMRLKERGHRDSAELEGRMDLAGRFASAYAALDRALCARDEGALPECIADDVKEALSWLAPERAHGLPEEILERIFASFCLGK